MTWGLDATVPSEKSKKPSVPNCRAIRIAEPSKYYCRSHETREVKHELKITREH